MVFPRMKAGILEPRQLYGFSQPIKSLLWLGGTAYDAPAALLREDGNCPWVLHRVVRDHLGSIVAVTDSAGFVEQRLSYDAWGALRNPDTGAAYAPGTAPRLMLMGRGYIGHEHLPWFGLVNMNARLYDPAVARFLSPDPMVQRPDGTQGFNRYSYCLNNPLRYVDLDGRYFRGDNLKKYRDYRSTIMGEIYYYTNEYTNTSDLQTKCELLSRIGELNNTLSDLDQMYLGGTEFSFGNSSFNDGIQETTMLPNGVVAMYTNGLFGNIVHEMRHGGQLARGEFGLLRDENGTIIFDSRYGISHEVSAYRAEFAAVEKLGYKTIYGFSIDITSINQITGLLITLFADDNGNSIYGGRPAQWYKR
ncbi:MAG: RHS repeat-associated core domain-containing protein [Muribaculaceae bacterium]|nr:RHS repeat-associated core domain-containing protein [Muribaculaceae bacterium]